MESIIFGNYGEKFCADLRTNEEEFAVLATQIPCF